MKFLTNLQWRIKRFFDWPIKSLQYAWFLRKDYDWDYGYILALLSYKLQRTRKRITSNDFICQEDIDKINTDIKHAEELIKRILADDYAWIDPEYKRLEQKWGSLVFSPDIGRVNAKTEAQRKASNAAFIKVYNRAHKAREADLDELFSHLRKNIQFWWD